MKFPVSIETIAGQMIPDLAHKFGTPVYVYDAAVIGERLGELMAFDVVRYAQKACSNLAILDLVRRHGALIDCVSAGEIRRALAAGFKPGPGKHPEIMFTADIFDHDSLDLVVDHDIPVNCGSPDMIDQLGARAPGREITLRINPGFGHGHSQKTNTGGEGSKHGIWHAQIGDCVQRAARYGIAIAGLHMHIGSGTDMKHLAKVCGAMEDGARQVGSTLHTISAGGGLPTPYRESDERIDIAEYFGLWDAARNRIAESVGHSVALELEPGRYVVAESGYLIAEIRAIKRMGNQCYYLVNAGFNDLARPILYGAYHPIAICNRLSNPCTEPKALASGDSDSTFITPPPDASAFGSGFKSDLIPVVVGGPLCESGDIFTQEAGGIIAPRELPVASVGDYLAILCAGAYSSVMGSNYNTRPFAAEVLIENGQAHLVRKRQTFEDIVAGEVIPKI